jgi:Zn-dependent peptidase ImmA (M78 family)
VKIDWKRAQELRQKAADLLKQAGTTRHPVDLVAICTFLGIRVEFVDRLGGVRLENPWVAKGIEVTGSLERFKKTIMISLAFPIEYQRYTLAHEIAHWILHQGLIHHREEVGLDGRSSPHQAKPEEREAQIFAAVLLMPDDQVVREFNARFGGAIDCTLPHEDLAHYLSVGTRIKIQPSALAHMPQTEKAKLFARCKSFEDRHFEPIAKSFGVSIEAMAYRLVELGLVY